jgi:MFS family permease
MVPAVLSIVALSLVKDQPATQRRRENMLETWKELSPQFKRYLVSAGIFSLAYFSFGFLLLRAHSVGFSIKDTVLLYALFNIACVIAAPAIGKLGDSVGRARMILLGYLIYLLMCLGFAFVVTKWQIIVLFIFYGVFYAIDEAQNKAFITDIELERRASAIGMYNFLTGIIYLPASLLAGAIWLINPASPFIAAACLALMAIVAFLVLRPDI